MARDLRVAAFVTGCVLVAVVSGCGTSDRSAAPVVQSDAPAVAQSAGLSCAQGGPCAVGDVGPGGGTVFFVASPPASWGQVLEAAPAGWAGEQDLEAPWCAAPSFVSTGLCLGDGGGNTAVIVAKCGAESAAGVAQAYRGGGKDDWFLPAKGELNALYQRREMVGGLTGDGYWSSSNDFYVDAWCQVFGDGFRSSDYQGNTNRVRPIRAF